MGDNMEFAGKSPHSLLERKPRLSKSVFELWDVSQCEDFSRESLGILDPNNSDFRRESLVFSNEDFGRESLAIRNLNNMDVGRDSLGFHLGNFRRGSFGNFQLNDFEIGRESLDPGRESLGIINLDGIDISRPSLGAANIRTFNYVLSQAQVHTPERLSQKHILLNNELLNSSIGKARCLSELPTKGSSSSVPSELNTAFLWEPSPAGVLNTTISTCLDNNVFLKSPSPQKNENLLNAPSEIDEAIFTEAEHLSWMIGSGSFLVDDNLDTTQEPEDFANVVLEDEPIRYDTETVFKRVDKLFTKLCLNPVESTEKDGSTSCQVSKETNIFDKPNISECSESPDSKPKEINISESDKSTDSKSKEENSKINNSQHSDKSSGSKSKEAIKAIRRLSEILSNATASPTQKNEGQNLLSNLAEMYTSDGSVKSRSCSLDFSAFECEPSVEFEGSQIYEALDLRKSSSDINSNHIESEVALPLDLSVKSKSGSEKTFVSPKVLPPKFNKIQKSINHSSLSNCSLSSNESRHSNDLSKFRSRKPDEKLAVKKGPMRAVLPLDNMAKKSSVSLKPTTRKSESRISTYQKKSSTPVRESKPVAQSTPENQMRIHPISPLARPNSSLQLRQKTCTSKFNYTGSPLPENKKLDGKKTPLLRRSSDDLRRVQNTSKSFTRSNSLVEKTTVLNKCDSNVMGKDASALKENQTRLIRRPSLIKKLGKENAAK